MQGRVVGIEDSHVTMFSQAKGRSSSHALTPVLQKTSMLQLGGRLYPAYHFCPSRLNVADDPTRLREVRKAVRAPPAWLEDPKVMQWLLELPPVRHTVGAWARFVLRIKSLLECRDKTPLDIECLAEGAVRASRAEPAYCRLRGNIPATKNIRERLG